MLTVTFRNLDVLYSLFTFKGMAAGYCYRFSNFIVVVVVVVCYVVAVGIDWVWDQETKDQ